LHIEEDTTGNKSSLLAKSEIKDQSPSPSKTKFNSSKLLFKQDSLPGRSASLQSKIPSYSTSASSSAVSKQQTGHAQQFKPPFLPNHLYNNLDRTASAQACSIGSGGGGSFTKPSQSSHLHQQQQLIQHQQQQLLLHQGSQLHRSLDKHLNKSSGEAKGFPSKDSVIKKMKKITKAVQELFKATKESDFES
jgi:hypothetical protein